MDAEVHARASRRRAGPVERDASGGSDACTYSGRVLEVETWPELREPVLVVALQGWVDAGMTGSEGVDLLRAQLGSSRRFATLDLADLVDLQQTRPDVVIDEGVTRRISWPTMECVAGRAGRDVVLVTGPEPSLRWPSVIRALVDMATRLGVVVAYGLGAMPAVTTHRRPVDVLATATDESLAEQVGALRTDYAGVTGLQTALLVALGEVGIPSVGLWGQVPHYLAGSPSPPATRAVLDRLTRLSGIELDFADLDRDVERYAVKVEAGLADRPDVAELVQAIETEHPAMPSGAELVDEIEQFLRSQPDQD
jgi:proteasome assembly chaperone (PAC2) family protein